MERWATERQTDRGIQLVREREMEADREAKVQRDRSRETDSREMVRETQRSIPRETGAGREP